MKRTLFGALMTLITGVTVAAPVVNGRTTSAANRETLGEEDRAIIVSLR